jgi:hypothetical protein
VAEDVSANRIAANIHQAYRFSLLFIAPKVAGIYSSLKTPAKLFGRKNLS